MKWVSLLMWAGANPRTPGPTFDERFGDDPECYTTALREACYGGKLDVLKRLKPDPKQDNSSDLLGCAVVPSCREVMEYLLSQGANPNALSGGSPALDHCLGHLGFADFDALIHKRLASKYAVQGTLDCIRQLVTHGAKWVPGDAREMNYVRQALYKCEPVVTVDVVKLLAEHKACTEETLERLLDTPRMRTHLSQLGMKL